ncbi:CC0125/CC1285 family lipoprotein [Photobacterium sp. DNB23_23_1]
MKNSRLIAFGLSALLLAGCATPYDTDRDSFWSFGKGFEVTPLAQDTWQISFIGNENTDRTLARNYLLHKAAELAKGAGYPYFALRGEQNFRDQTGSTSGIGFSSNDFLYGTGSTITETTVMVEVIGMNEKPTERNLSVYESDFVLNSVDVRS